MSAPAPSEQELPFSHSPRSLAKELVQRAPKGMVSVKFPDLNLPFQDAPKDPAALDMPQTVSTHIRTYGAVFLAHAILEDHQTLQQFTEDQLRFALSLGAAYQLPHLYVRLARVEAGVSEENRWPLKSEIQFWHDFQEKVYQRANPTPLGAMRQ